MIGGVVTLGPPAQCKQTRSINKSKQADYIVNQFYGRVFRDNHILWLRQKRIFFFSLELRRHFINIL